MLYTVFNGYLYFTGFDGTDYSIWKTDGTLAGTTLLKDINPGNAGSDPTGAIIFNNEFITKKTFSVLSASPTEEL